MKRSYSEIETIKKLGFDSYMEYELCMKCDYTNNDVPISKKKPQRRCDFLNCDPYIMTKQLENRIGLERGDNYHIAFFRNNLSR